MTKRSGLPFGVQRRFSQIKPFFRNDGRWSLEGHVCFPSFDRMHSTSGMQAQSGHEFRMGVAGCLASAATNSSRYPILFCWSEYRVDFVSFWLKNSIHHHEIIGRSHLSESFTLGLRHARVLVDDRFWHSRYWHES